MLLSSFDRFHLAQYLQGVPLLLISALFVLLTIGLLYLETSSNKNDLDIVSHRIFFHLNAAQKQISKLVRGKTELKRRYKDIDGMEMMKFYMKKLYENEESIRVDSKRASLKWLNQNELKQKVRKWKRAQKRKADTQIIGLSK